LLPNPAYVNEVAYPPVVNDVNALLPVYAIAVRAVPVLVAEVTSLPLRSNDRPEVDPFRVAN